MRIYEGAPRQNYQEVLRSMGAYLDQRGMREVLLVEAADGFILQALLPDVDESKWAGTSAHIAKESLSFLDEEISGFIDAALARRGTTGPDGHSRAAGFYENAFRVLGSYIDQQKPHDIFLLEQDHSFVLRLLMQDRIGPRHVLAEFTRDDIEAMVTAGPQMRGKAPLEPRAFG
jgi:hypothetical protein